VKLFENPPRNSQKRINAMALTDTDARDELDLLRVIGTQQLHTRT